MNSMDIRPFIPAVDFEASKLFYQALGFTSDDATDDLTIISSGSCSFFLYKYDEEKLENNFMLQLAVPNIDDALESIKKAEGFNTRYEGITEERWGKVIYLWGPSGELWHVTEHASE